MKIMKRSVITILLVSLLCACTISTPTKAPVSSEEAVSASAPTAAEIPLQGTSTNGRLWVRIDQPVDGSVLTTGEVVLKGSAPVGTTLTINDDLIYLEKEEQFNDVVKLTKGVNEIEIIASDVLGNEVDLYLTVYYEP